MIQRLYRLVVAFIFLASVSGCRHDPTVWRKEFRSPDGAWIATARTEQQGGFGSAWVETIVSIRKADGTVNRGKSFDVFSFPGGGRIPKTYVLSDENLDPDLRVRWVSPTQLQISHLSAVDPGLKVVRFADVDVSFQ